MTALSSSEQEKGYYAKRLKLNNRLYNLVAVRGLLEAGILLRGDRYGEWNLAEERALVDMLVQDDFPEDDIRSIVEAGKKNAPT